jgi:hypothetical protein
VFEKKKYVPIKIVVIDYGPTIHVLAWEHAALSLPTHFFSSKSVIPFLGCHGVASLAHAFLCRCPSPPPLQASTSCRFLHRTSPTHCLCRRFLPPSTPTTTLSSSPPTPPTSTAPCRGWSQRGRIRPRVRRRGRIRAWWDSAEVAMRLQRSMRDAILNLNQVNFSSLTKFIESNINIYLCK